jgi:hypothetical protein
VSWSFGAPTGGITSDFLASLSNQTNPILTAFFIFGTVNGQIVAWAWSISWNFGYDGVVIGNGTMTSVSADGLGSDSWVGSPESGVSHCGFAYACDSYSADAFSPGAWISPVISPPSNTDVLNCFEGQNVYKVVPVSNSTSSKNALRAIGTQCLCSAFYRANELADSSYHQWRGYVVMGHAL